LRSQPERVANKVLSPSVSVAPRYYITQSPHPVPLFPRMHPQGLRQYSCGFLDVPWIDRQSMFELACGTRKLAQHEDTPLVLVGAHELLAHQVHAVLKAGHEAHIRCTQIREHLRRFVVGFQQDHGFVLRTAEAQVDAVHRRRDT
jgi:hypothetical protein